MKVTEIFVIMWLTCNLAIPAEYQVDKSKENIVKIISNAPLEDFEGITNKIDGYIYWSDTGFLKNSEMYFEVDLNSLDTGIGLRNRHMRENYLETDRFPYAHFTGKLINFEKQSETEFLVSAEGKMFIHGVENNLTVQGNMIQIENGFRMQTSFITPLTEYKIKIPQLMFFKIDENIKVLLDFYIQKLAEDNK